MCVAANCNRPLYKDGYCKTHSPELQRKRRADNPDRYKGYSLQRDYGISLQDYNELLLAQKGVCAVCGTPDGSERSNNNGSKRLSVDHDHMTGAVRGLLCAACNQGIGSLMDSVTLLQQAVRYLQEHEKRQTSLADAADDVLQGLLQL